MLRLLLLLLAFCVGCAPAVHQARLDPMAEPSPREADAEQRWEDRACGKGVGWLWPGLGPACVGRPAEAAALGVLGTAEFAGGIALLATHPDPAELDAFEQGGRLLPLLAWQNTWSWSLSRPYLDHQLARRLPYTPQDELTELMAAPFNPRVLERPGVWAPTVGLAAGAAALSVLLADAPLGGRASAFGVEGPWAYPAAAAGGVVLMEHVAIGEEVTFRGLLQSGLVRSTGSETWGWALGSLIFGGTHALNLLALPPEEHLQYAAVSLPWITLTGSFLGLAYRWSGYSLTAPVAMHFWYNLLVTSVDFALHPDESLFRVRIGGGW